MRIRELGTRAASASLLEMFQRVKRGHAPTATVQRRELPYWQEHGWTQENNRYTGNYQTPYAAFEGWIEQERSGHMHFFLHSPSAEIRRHSHWTCFQHRGDHWYLVHMGRQPKDVSSGIMTIERLIKEAYEQ